MALRLENFRTAETREVLREQLGGFWKGTDVKTAADTLLQPGTTFTLVSFPEGSLPSLNLKKYADTLKYFQGSMRSRYAQLGVEPDRTVGQVLTESYVTSQGTEEPLELPLVNNTKRSIAIPKNTDVFRLYSEVAGDMLTGKDLVEAVHNEELKIDGRKGKEWDFIYKNGLKEDKDIMGINVRILPIGYLAPDEENSIVSIDPMGKNYRAEIDKLLTPQIPMSETPLCWIGETCEHVQLSPAIEGVLMRNTRVTDHSNPHIGLDEKGRHINSLLIDGGTKWNVRVEVVSPTADGKMPEFVPFRFYRANTKR